MSTTTHLDDETLSAIADGAERAPAHLDSCAECQGRLQKYAALHAMLALDEDITPSAALRQRVFADIARERPRRRWFDVLIPAFGAAVAIVVALTIEQPNGPNDDELFVAENQEMLADMPMLEQLDAVEDFDAIAALEEAP